MLSALTRRPVDAALRGLRAAVWLVAAIALAFGAAGAVQGAAHPPGDATRPELTWRADAALAPGIEALRGGIVSLQAQVARLSTIGRQALVDLTAQDQPRLTADLDAGDQVVLGIVTDSAQLTDQFRALPYGVASEAIGQATREKLQAIDGALLDVVPIAGDWGRVSAGAVPAITLVGLLTAHDQQAFAAVRQGSAGHYPQALAQLKVALATLAKATAIRDQLLPTGVDVSTIDAWITANRTYDTALQRLYGLLNVSGGRVTLAIRTAFSNVQTAQQGLPANTQGLVVIVGDIAQGGLTQALLDIDAARGSLVLAAAAVN